MTPIRLLTVASGLTIVGPVGGIARFTIDLSSAFERAVVAPALIGLWDYHTPYEQVAMSRLEQAGIAAWIAAPWDEQSPYASCVHAVQALRRLDFGTIDIIHSHGEFSDLAALWLRQRIGARFVVRTVHNEREWAKRPLYGKVFPNLLYPWAFDAEFTVSKQAAHNLDQRPLARLLRRRGQVIPAAIRTERFEQVTLDRIARFDRTAKRRQLGIVDDSFVIGTIGRLVPQKGYAVLIEAIPDVLAKHPHCSFLLIGEGALRQTLQNQAQQLGVAERVIFAGGRSDVEELYPIMDLFVSSSLWEGMPAVILESMASQTPVVATRVSGTTELVIDKETGLLAAPGNSEELARCICTMIEQPELRRSLAQRAKKEVVEQFSMARIAARYAAAYRTLTG